MCVFVVCVRVRVHVGVCVHASVSEYTRVVACTHACANTFMCGNVLLFHIQNTCTQIFQCQLCIQVVMYSRSIFSLIHVCT